MGRCFGGETEGEVEMAVEQMNTSYDRCIAALRERYRGRGISENARKEAAMQIKNEANTRGTASASYVLFDSRSKIADIYRSGEYNGSKYMTSEDFVRYFKSRRALSVPALEKEELPEEAELRGVARRNTGASRTGLVSGESGGKEAHLQTLISAAKEFAYKWFPVERKEGRENGSTFRFPVAAMSGIAVFAISLGLIVGGSVMMGNASGESSRLERTISKLEAQQVELQERLDVKYSIDEIEAEMKSLGMVKRQSADNEYLSGQREEQIIVYEDGESENVGLATLLAAFGIKLD